MERVRKLIAKVAPTDSTVLILGETGTGKELVARAVHHQSLRPRHAVRGDQLRGLARKPDRKRAVRPSQAAASPAPMNIASACSKWPTAARSSWTKSASCPSRCRPSCCEFLESGEIRRVGENESFTVDVRVVCATHRNLEEMVERRRFREDLMFRINTFEINLPPLRERIADVPQLAAHLLQRFRPHLRSGDEPFTPEAIENFNNTIGPATCASWPT